jgi:hypothetical protein
VPNPIRRAQLRRMTTRQRKILANRLGIQDSSTDAVFARECVDALSHYYAGLGFTILYPELADPYYIPMISTIKQIKICVL